MLRLWDPGWALSQSWHVYQHPESSVWLVPSSYPSKCIKEGSSLPGWRGPLYPLSLLLLLPDTHKVSSLFPKDSSGFVEGLYPSYPSTLNLSLSWELSEQLPGCLRVVCCLSVYRTCLLQHLLWVLVSSLSCIIFPRCTDKNKCLAQGHCSASAVWSPGSRLECCAEGCVCGYCSWGDKGELS